MSILSDKEIRERCSGKNKKMISPFIDQSIRETKMTITSKASSNKNKKNNNIIGSKEKKVLSYGLSSYGYDVRVSDEFKIFTNINNSIIDPKEFSNENFVTKKTKCCILPPNSFALANTVETFDIPRDILVICVGKSTYARCGIVVNVTPIEPEFKGQVVLEFSNTTNLPAKIYANEGACQFLFFKADVECETSYNDRAGKYQNQKGIVLPKV